MIGFNGAPLDTADKSTLRATLASIPPSLASNPVGGPGDDVRRLEIVQFIGGGSFTKSETSHR